MRKSIVLIVALAEELDRERIPGHIPVVYSGVGKVNAAIAAFKAIQQFKPELILNFGTVGKINPAVSGLVQIGAVVQRDMIAEPLAPRGTVPFSHQPNKLHAAGEGLLCGTGDSFVTNKDSWLIENQIDVVDMELFAIAAVAHEHHLPWLSYKFISDDANESSGQEWSQQVHRGQELFLEELNKHDRS